MSHYLSDVTHQRLELRQDVGEDVPSDGIEAFGEFFGCFRCAEVAPGFDPSRPQVSEMTIWTGEQDGTIGIRRGLLGEQTHSLERKKGTFVYSLLCTGPYMWAGLSDGYIRVFEVASMGMLVELKAHVGCVNTMLMAQQYVFSGGADWQIVKWDPVALRKAAHGTLTGHQNSVRCLAGDGNALFSGGDDYAIRCWGLDDNTERMAPFPIIGHRASVKALVVHEVFLFSGSADGTIKVWNTQTGQLLRQLDRREQSVNSLMLDPASNNVWSGCADGTVSVWDTQDLHLVKQMNSHKNAIVSLLKMMARVNALKVWTMGTDGKVKVWYSDNDTTATDFSIVTEQELATQEEIDLKRAQIIRNYKELETSQSSLQQLESRDKSRKERAAAILANKRSLELKRFYTSKLLKWIIQRRQNTRRTTLAEAMFNTTQRSLRSYYYSKLVKYSIIRQQHRRKMEISTALQRSTEDALKRVYLHNLLEHSRRYYASKKRANMGDVLLRSVQSHLRRRVLVMWQRFAKQTAFLSKRDRIVESLAKNNNNAMISLYWHKLERFVTQQRAAERRAKTTESLNRLTEEGLRRIYFNKLRAFPFFSKAKRVRDNIGDRIVGVSQMDLLAKYFHAWGHHVADKPGHTLLEEVEIQKAEIANLERVVEESANLTEEDLDRRLREKQEELARVMAETEALDDDVAELLDQRRKLRRDYQKDDSWFDQEKPLRDQLDHALFLLKARGVNVGLDFEIITKAREQSKATSPAQVYEHGIATVRKVCANVIRPEKLRDGDAPEWYVGDLFNSITDRNLTKAADAIRSMVVAYDVLTVGEADSWFVVHPTKGQGFATKHRHNNELVQNFSTFSEIVMRSYDKRRGQIEAGERKRKKAGIPSRTPSHSVARSVTPPLSGRTPSASPRAAEHSPSPAKSAATPTPTPRRPKTVGVSGSSAAKPKPKTKAGTTVGSTPAKPLAKRGSPAKPP